MVHEEAKSTTSQASLTISMRYSCHDFQAFKTVSCSESKDDVFCPSNPLRRRSTIERLGSRLTIYMSRTCNWDNVLVNLPLLTNG